MRYVTVNGKRYHASGWKKDLPDDRDQHYKVSFWQRFKLPASATVRNSPYISKIEDQGSIGSCTCNSSTSVHEMVLKRSGVDVQLSRLWLYAKVREFEGTPLTEDSGAQIRDVMKVLAKQGVPLESSYPYDTDKWQQEPPAALAPEAAKHQILVYYRCPTLAQIKASIWQGFSVVGGFSCPKSLFSDATTKTGVIEYAPVKGFDGGHAVMFVGYDDAKRLLCFQNSWGPDWGDGGYGYLPYDYVENGYADDFWTIRQAEV